VIDLSDEERNVAILVATSNRGKLRELKALIPKTTKLYALSDFSIKSPEETGRTFLENAVLKADHASRSVRMCALADDSGLEVDALAGLPGVASARYAGPNASDSENNLKLIDALLDVPDEQRTASFRCAVAFKAPDGFLLTATGSLSGRIILNPRGKDGFGYDPHFEIYDSEASEFNGCTLAELALDEKSSISHRWRAFDNLVQISRATSPGHPSARLLHDWSGEASN